MESKPSLKDKVTRPVFHLFDKVGQTWLRETEEGKFGFANRLEFATPYWSEAEASAAALRAGGDVKVYPMTAYVDPEPAPVVFHTDPASW